MKEKFSIKVKIGDKEYDLPWQKELESSEATINENLIEQAPIFGWYAVLTALAKSQINDRKLDLANTDANLAEKYRKKAVEGGEKVTEKRILELVEMDDKHIEAVVLLNMGLKDHAQLAAITDAFAHRKEMISGLASNLRKELDMGMTFKQKG